MKNNSKRDKEPTELRRRAERQIAKGSPPDIALGSPEQAMRLVHELRVHQIELEMQNEELKASRQVVEQANAELARRIEDLTRCQQKSLLQTNALEAVASAILICDAQGVIKWVNPAFTQTTGYSAQDVIGKTPSLLKPGGFEDKLYRKLWETVTAGKVWSGQFVNQRKDGVLYDEEMTVTPIRNALGEIEHFIAIKQDITERKKLEAQFMRAQRMESIGTLAGGLAHDLNNILAPILLSVDLLKRLSENPEALAMLRTIEGCAQRGADVVQQVLSFTRGVPGKRMAVPPAAVFRDLENIIQSTFPKKIRSRFSIEDNIWSILGDPTQVQQVLLNLCLNSRDAMPYGGTLTVRAENCEMDEQTGVMDIRAKARRYVKFSVIDTGEGISPKLLDKIFEPFFTTKDVNKGTGLGLSTALAVVKSHGGIIQIKSEPGNGTTIDVFFPTAETSADAATNPPAPTALPRGKNETILVVDDEIALLTLASMTLQSYGYQVLKATSGAEAVALCTEHKKKIAAVITDLRMPVMDGAAVIRSLQAINPAIKIIAASGLHADEDVTEAKNAGVKHFITKPYSTTLLLGTLRSLLDEAETP